MMSARNRAGRQSLAAAVVGAVALAVISAPTGHAAPVEYERDIRPIFAKHCVKCHGPEKQQGGLRLDLKSSAFQGGDSGERAILPHKAEKSWLVQLITSTDENERMPPSGDRLTAAQVEKIRRWIDAGADWPQSDAAAKPARRELVVTDEDREHWSFRPLARVTPPEVGDAAWCRTPVDRFIRRAQELQGLKPSAPATTRVLVRRAYFDLIGLPPRWKPETEPSGAEGQRRTEELLGTEYDLSDTAVGLPESAVERLLGSEHYGERWARHWLDAARYADSDGQEGDADRPNAYRFRDFVIRALNEDLPFNTFVRWQIAGDEIEPANPQAIAATGFLVAGNSTNLKVPMEEEKLRNRANELDDMVSTTGQALLALTLGCCRCHDHKYDPVPTRDYYRLMRTFNGGDRRDVPLAAPEVVQAHSEQMSAWQSEFDAAAKRRDDWLKQAREPIAAGLRAAKIGKLPLSDEEKKLLTDSPDDGKAKALANRFKKELRIDDAEYVAALPESEQARWRELDAAVKKIASRKPAALPQAFAFADFSAEPRETWFFERGDFLARNEQMDLGFLTVLTRGKTPAEYWAEARQERRRDDSTQQRRALADWIVDLDHGPGALLARVIVNRVWQHHFGDGLVRTPNDFGTRGEQPSHPELLEWLAGELVQHGWSLKHLHRLIVNSATYQQSSSFDAAQAAVDPENRLYWRFRPRRLESELLRDAMLAAAGTLNPAMYGPSFKPPIPVEAMQARNVKDPYPRDIRESPETLRRTVYMFHKRVVQYPLMQAFDAPDAQVSCGRRVNTTVAPQALALLNDPFVRSRAEELARRLESESGGDTDAQIRRACELTLSRAPTTEEREEIRRFISSQIDARRQHDPKQTEAAARSLALVDFCQALFGLNEFIYVD
jgi:mono/diheme cytochrome c family protein